MIDTATHDRRPDRNDPSPHRSHPARDGARDVLPMLVTVMPLALVVGATTSSAHVDHLAAWAASFLMVAGAAQLAMVQMLDDGAGLLAVVATTAAINARFVVFSVALGHWFGAEPLRRRLALAFPLVDQIYLLADVRFSRDDDVAADRPRYYLGAAAVMVGGWSATQVLGMALAGSAPAIRVLAAAAPVAFAGLLVPTLRTRRALAAAVAGGATTVAVATVAPVAALVSGIAAGIGAASLAGRSDR